MRILAGEHRGRVLRAPPGLGTRPMLARVRESLFGTLGARVQGARVLDLFAGSGSLALEALSRGAAHARLVEKDREVLPVLSQNVEALRVGERVEIVRANALDPRAWSSDEGAWIDLAFFDPPYRWLRDARRKELFATLARVVDEALAPGGLIVFHAPRHALMTRDFPAGSALRERVYGTSSLWYVGRPGEDAPDDEDEVGDEAEGEPEIEQDESDDEPEARA